MGTRSEIRVYGAKSDTPLVCIYQPYDGYPEGVGKVLADFACKGRVVDGLTRGSSILEFNGAGDFAAQFIAEIKTGPGGEYLIADGEDWGQEFVYKVTIPPAGGEIAILVSLAYSKGILFDGLAKDYSAWLDAYLKEEGE